MSNDMPKIYAEKITNVSMANGVFRITLAQEEAEGKSTDVARLLIPANQLGPILGAIGGAAKEIGAKVGEARKGADKDEGEEK
ncbi:MAG: hypothetical protein HQL35_15295 [Alphaproteobacteria bacterium]|nr:hypothetical protein [Alphaproteobacteria bacterium]